MQVLKFKFRVVGMESKVENAFTRLEEVLGPRMVYFGVYLLIYWLSVL